MRVAAGGGNLLCPWRNLLEVLARGFDFGRADVFQRCRGVSVERGKGGQVELRVIRKNEWACNVNWVYVLTSMRRILPTPLRMGFGQSRC